MRRAGPPVHPEVSGWGEEQADLHGEGWPPTFWWILDERVDSDVFNLSVIIYIVEFHHGGINWGDIH